ncbi:hypothetical protein QQS21_001920 [Conoideocrella luteorostrata]|uniref:Uncharacterized protein n=1 Tax=Conoideocrella luteorostrata TaxID=1105319 RepID=A0AAJ0CWA1_9HYPO|nr:hypothetical protein QQS21_001920 [Conoideocrella luteorostrata]
MNLWGIDQFTHRNEILAVPENLRNMLHVDAMPRVFIVTPRPRVEYFQPNGERSTDEQRQSTNANAGSLLFEKYVKQLEETISRRMGPRVSVNRVEYSPNVASNSWWNGRDAAQDHDKPQMDMHIAVELGDITQKNSRGKVLIQHQPARDCQQMASWRVWVEDRGTQDRHDSWTPLESQILPAQGGERGGRKRAACPAKPSTHQSSTKTTSHTTTTKATTTHSSATRPSSKPTNTHAPPTSYILFANPRAKPSGTQYCQCQFGSVATDLPMKTGKDPCDYSQLPKQTASSTKPPTTTTKTKTSISTTTTAPAYATGTCTLHITEIHEGNGVFVNIKLKDGAGAEMAIHSQQINVSCPNPL